MLNTVPPTSTLSQVLIMTIVLQLKTSKPGMIRQPLRWQRNALPIELLLDRVALTVRNTREPKTLFPERVANHFEPKE